MQSAGVCDHYRANMLQWKEDTDPTAKEITEMIRAAMEKRNEISVRIDELKTELRKRSATNA